MTKKRLATWFIGVVPLAIAAVPAALARQAPPGEAISWEVGIPAEIVTFVLFDPQTPGVSLPEGLRFIPARDVQNPSLRESLDRHLKQHPEHADWAFSFVEVVRMKDLVIDGRAPVLPENGAVGVWHAPVDGSQLAEVIPADSFPSGMDAANRVSILELGFWIPDRDYVAYMREKGHRAEYGRVTLVEDSAGVFHGEIHLDDLHVKASGRPREEPRLHPGSFTATLFQAGKELQSVLVMAASRPRHRTCDGEWSIEGTHPLASAVLFGPTVLTSYDTPSTGTEYRLRDQAQPRVIAADEGASSVGYNGFITLRKVGSLSTGATQLYLGSGVVPPGTETPTHLHEVDEEVLYVLEGEITLTLGDEVHTVGTGGTAFVPPGTWMKVENRSDAPARVLGILPRGNVDRCFRAIYPTEGDYETEAGRTADFAFCKTRLSEQPPGEPADEALRDQARSHVVGPREGHVAVAASGMEVQFKVGSVSTGASGLMMATSVFPPGHETPTHLHEIDEEVVYVLHGELTATLEGQEHTVGPGGTVFVPPGTWMALGNRTETSVVVLGVLSRGEAEECFRVLFSTDADETARLEALELCGLAHPPPVPSE